MAGCVDGGPIQGQGIRIEKQEALAQVTGYGGTAGLALPMEEAEAVVIAWEGGQAQLLQKGGKPVVAGAAPLAPQIDRGTGGGGGSDQATTDPCSGLKHSHPQALALQPAGCHQPREAGADHHHIYGFRRGAGHGPWGRS